MNLIRQIRDQQRKFELILPLFARCRLCREMVQNINAEYSFKFEGINRPEVTRIQLRATDALQVAATVYMHEFFTSRSKCVTDAITDK